MIKKTLLAYVMVGLMLTGLGMVVAATASLVYNVAPLPVAFKEECAAEQQCKPVTIENITFFCKAETCTVEEIAAAVWSTDRNRNHDLRLQLFWHTLAIAVLVVLHLKNTRFWSRYLRVCLFILVSIFFIWGIGNGGEKIFWEFTKTTPLFAQSSGSIVLFLTRTAITWLLGALLVYLGYRYHRKSW